MKKIKILMTLLFGSILMLSAQDYNEGQPPVNTRPTDHAWELGVHGGHLFFAGNVDFLPSYGVGLHVRRALDYVFSLRLDLMYGQGKGEDAGNVRDFENTWLSGSLQTIVTLNNLKWEIGERKTHLYGLAGLGLNSFDATVNFSDAPSETIESDVTLYGEFGAGIGFRINERVNIGVEHKVGVTFGNRADLADGVQTIVVADDRGTFRDYMHYTSVRINFNFTAKGTKSEPLYWLNPLEGVMADLQKLKDTRVVLEDTDGDGVIDMMDEEEATPEGAPVDSKGVLLDSDKDGIADYQDQEPYSPGGYEINEQGVAQVPNIMDEVNKLVDEKLAAYEPKQSTTQPVVNQPTSAAWFLPVIYFSYNGSKISTRDYATLASIADVMKENVNLKFVVTGHTDQTGTDSYNNKLSYNRAKAVIDHLMERHGVSRSQLILQWKGEAVKLTEGRHLVNRRVQFKVANGETEMAAPSE